MLTVHREPSGDRSCSVKSRSTFDLSPLPQFFFLWPLKVFTATSSAGFYGDDHLTSPGGVIQPAFLEWERWTFFEHVMHSSVFFLFCWFQGLFLFGAAHKGGWWLRIMRWFRGKMLALCNLIMKCIHPPVHVWWHYCSERA